MNYIIKPSAHEQLIDEPSDSFTMLDLFRVSFCLVQYAVGILVTSFTVVITIRALATEATSSNLPFYAIMFTFAAAIILVAYLEGLHVTIITLMHVNNNTIPGRARKTHWLATQNLERFVIGRQFVITGMVFVCSFITKVSDDTKTCDWASEWVPFEICDFVLSTGLGGSLIVLAFGQILPQLIAASHPVYHYSLPGMYILVWFCNFVAGACELCFCFADFIGVEDGSYGVHAMVEAVPLEEDPDPVNGISRSSSESHPIFRLIRYVVSVAMVVTSGYYCVDSLANGGSEFELSTWELCLLVVALVIVMYMLEGAMTTVLALEKTPIPEDTVGCSKITDNIIRKGDFVRKFLLGRQFLVVFADFALCRALGMYALPLVVIFCQATPQLVAARNPSGFHRWSFPIFYLSLIVEFTGVTHTGWLLACIGLEIGEGCGLLQSEAFSVGERVRWIGVQGGEEEPTPGHGLRVV